MINFIKHIIVCLFLVWFTNVSIAKNSNGCIIKMKNDKSIPTFSTDVNYKKIRDKLFSIKTSCESVYLDNTEYVEPNYTWYIDNYQPFDPLFSDLWGMNNPIMSGVDINAIKAWNTTTGSKDVKVMVIDTGIDYTHPDLKANIWTNLAELNGTVGIDDDNNGCIDDIHGCDYVNNDGDPIDDHSHGTHCAGTIGAVHNGIGVAGVMANVELVGCKFLTARGQGSTSGAIKCIDYGIKIGVNIMSNSWGGGQHSVALKEAIERARDAGIIFVAAAGNSGTNNDSKPHYPSSYKVDNIVSVASHTINNKLSSFSCYGKKTVHVAAPGSNIVSTIVNGKYKSLSGTSMATPHVSGAIGLLLSNERELSVHDVVERILMTSVPVKQFKGKLKTNGRLDAYNLLTNTRPERSIPDESKWKTIKLDKPWESSHPYKSNIKIKFKLDIPEAKYIRLKIKKMDLELRYDTITISSNGEKVVSLTGKSSDMYTEPVEGDNLTFLFKSDRSINKWGFIVEEYQFQ